MGVNTGACFETDLKEVVAFVEKDHSKLFNRDKEDQHPIKAIEHLEETLDNKVTKEEGKGLSSNDFTDELKEKLENLDALDFDVNDPEDKQVILYDSESETWKNYDLTDNNSIVYLDDDTKGLSIKHYKDASQGQMLVKDSNEGLYWVDPVSDESLQEAVRRAENAAERSSNSAITSGNYAGQAIQAAKQVEEKFWYGTIEEYNQLEVIHRSTIYIILDE